MSARLAIRICQDAAGQRHFAIVDAATGEAIALCHSYPLALGLLVGRSVRLKHNPARLVRRWWRGRTELTAGAAQ